MKKCTLDGAEIGNMIGKPLNSNQKCAPPECLLGAIDVALAQSAFATLPLAKWRLRQMAAATNGTWDTWQLGHLACGTNGI